MIRAAMERKRLNQAQLASELGVSRSALNSWINDRAWPQGSVGALEDVLDIRIYTDAGEPPPPIKLTERIKKVLREDLGEEAAQRVIDAVEKPEDPEPEPDREQAPGRHERPAG
jgi:transcriptional regulator with XRE-family HTH domain